MRLLSTIPVLALVAAVICTSDANFNDLTKRTNKPPAYQPNDPSPPDRKLPGYYDSFELSEADEREIARKAGLPFGVVKCVEGGKRIFSPTLTVSCEEEAECTCKAVAFNEDAVCVAGRRRDADSELRQRCAASCSCKDPLPGPATRQNMQKVKDKLAKDCKTMQNLYTKQAEDPFAARTVRRWCAERKRVVDLTFKERAAWIEKLKSKLKKGKAGSGIP